MCVRERGCECEGGRGMTRSEDVAEADELGEWHTHFKSMSMPWQ